MSCHKLPPRPPERTPVSSELTSIRSFSPHLRWIADDRARDEKGAMVQLVDVHEWARPFSGLTFRCLPTRYRLTARPLSAADTSAGADTERRDQNLR